MRADEFFSFTGADKEMKDPAVTARRNTTEGNVRFMACSVWVI
jgi:hypothetical protein